MVRGPFAVARVRAAVAVALLAATAAARAEEASAATRAELVALTRELMDAIAPGKAEVWDRLLAEDAIVVDEFGRKQGKRDAVKDLKPLPAGFSGTIEVRDPEVHAFGDTAVIDFEAYEQEKVFDQQLVVRYRFLGTWLRRGDGWKLVAMQDLTLPSDPPALPVRGLRLDDYPGTYRYGPGRAFTIRRSGEGLVLATRAGGKEVALSPVAPDVFTDRGEEKNLLIFQRGRSGRVERLIERRKFSDLHLERVDAPAAR
jgi:ketosteroid isomerase-like protein